MSDEAFFQGLCALCHLEPLGEPRRLLGGYSHRMMELNTRQGRFAVKLLNPAVMRREDALANYHRAEALEARLEADGLPILPALTVNGCKMQQVDGQYAYLFPYYEGRALKNDELTPAHSRAIGQVLAQIHLVDWREEAATPGEISIDWAWYVDALQKAGETELHSALQAARPMLEEMQRRGNEAQKRLPPWKAICHGDMDGKNVLWQEKDFRIIDLECLDFGNPAVELGQLAQSWSGMEAKNLRIPLLSAFLQGYAEAGAPLPEDWAAVYDSNTVMLDWLAYSLRRAMGIEGAPQEGELGHSQCRYALDYLAYLYRMRDEVLQACRQLAAGR